MTLKHWLKKKGMSAYKFSQRSGIPTSLLSRWLAGDGKPGLDNAVLISQVTGGQVSVEDLASQPARGGKGQ